jgi:hypothetical protein
MIPVLLKRSQMEKVTAESGSKLLEKEQEDLCKAGWVGTVVHKIIFLHKIIYPPKI